MSAQTVPNTDTFQNGDLATEEINAVIARAKAPTGNPTLADSAREFAQHWSPRILVGGMLLSLLARIYVGHWTIWDAVIAVAFIAWQPLQEWLIHVHILHWKPRMMFGKRIDFKLAKLHRFHHADPWDVPTLFVPLDAIVLSGVIQTTLIFLLMPTFALALSALVMVWAVGVAYEWVHFLVHTAYRPKTNWFRKKWHFHRLHHFKNEHYWQGVSMHQADWLLHTQPDPKTVESSPTARNLNENNAMQ